MSIATAFIIGLVIFFIIRTPKPVEKKKNFTLIKGDNYDDQDVDFPRKQRPDA